MLSNNRWLLPDGIEELLPEEARSVERLRREILNVYDSWGYDLVMPAMIEYLDSLLTGTAHSLDIKTFTLVDQLSGRQMGVRSDMTPQVARIDAHYLSDNAISRLCYCGHLLHAQADGITSSRSPLQIGAEIYGNESIAADIEVVCLMLETLHTAGLDNVSIDLGHVGIFRNLIQESELGEDTESQLFNMLQRKSMPELNGFLEKLKIKNQLREHVCQLALLNGDVSIVKQARQVFSICSTELLQALDHIETVALAVQVEFPDTLIHCDLSELRGYEYHTGLVFAAFQAGQGKEIARGGRYDDVGAAFGEARPATGFSTDLHALNRLSTREAEKSSAILAPDIDSAALRRTIRKLRKDNQRVIIDLSAGNLSASEQQCDRQLIQQGESWQVIEI